VIKAAFCSLREREREPEASVSTSKISAGAPTNLMIFELPDPSSSFVCLSFLEVLFS
jgi:hypothetical protein